jgi:hypothetical protein
MPCSILLKVVQGKPTASSTAHQTADESWLQHALSSTRQHPTGACFSQALISLNSFRQPVDRSLPARSGFSPPSRGVCMSRILARLAACCMRLSWPPMVERGVRMGVANLQEPSQNAN